ncbi:MAG: 3-hydroxy-3-methylglutaryl-CoA reductase [Verrucomicrobia bacterium]|nr:3-hydroxy-3-methylglutaryl-CoA reductase [Verrucomicrobiota bacterium]
MSISHRDANALLRRILENHTADEIERRLRPKPEKPLPPRVPGASLTSPEAVARRWRLVEAHVSAAGRAALHDEAAAREHTTFAHNVENFLGTVKVPVGLAGPLRVNGTYAQDDFYVPLATTEAALVASYHRGALAISESGGCSALTHAEGVSRAPGFAFCTLHEAGVFVAWALGQLEEFKSRAEATTRHGKLEEMRVTVEGNHVYLTFDFLTGNAAGQNMVTVATQAICDYVAQNSPVPPRHVFVEANLSGDKKASAQSFQTVRGKKVSAEVRVARATLARRLRTTAEKMEAYWRMSALGGVMSGTIGVQGHYANGLAALYLATGQDVACVSESAVGVTRFEADPCDGSLYACVTLPNLIVGTVGGGTGLPSQRASLEILQVIGKDARCLAEVAAALALAGELSIIAALSVGEFTRAHRKLSGRAEPQARMA